MYQGKMVHLEAQLECGSGFVGDPSADCAVGELPVQAAFCPRWKHASALGWAQACSPQSACCGPGNAADTQQYHTLGRRNTGISCCTTLSEFNSLFCHLSLLAWHPASGETWRAVQTPRCQAWIVDKNPGLILARMPGMAFIFAGFIQRRTIHLSLVSA